MRTYMCMYALISRLVCAGPIRAVGGGDDVTPTDSEDEPNEINRIDDHYGACYHSCQYVLRLTDARVIE
eukprot:COSAG05_NODE_1361_length_5090_cov_2.050491_6_plen_69_part_00